MRWLAINSIDWNDGCNISINDAQAQAPLASIDMVAGTRCEVCNLENLESFRSLEFDSFSNRGRFGGGALGNLGR